MNTRTIIYTLLLTTLAYNGFAADTATAPSTLAAQEEETVNTTPLSSTPPADQHSYREMLIVKETEDTVFVLDQSSIRNLIRNWQSNIGTLRKRSIGLSGMSTYGSYAISIAPVKELIETTPYLSSKNFHFGRLHYEPFFTSGGSGFIGLGDGFRLGGGGMSGQRTFSSNRYNGDSILVLGVKVSCGGFTVEKAVVNDCWNFVAGGTIGAGSIKVTATEKNSSSWFIDANEDMDTFDEMFQKGNSAEAGFFLFEPHCGASYTFFHFCHIGVNVTLPTFISVEKFNIYTNDFLTINPGIALKLIFGNLG